LGIYIAVVLLDYMAGLFLVFWGATILFFIVVVLIYIPTCSGWGFLSPHPRQYSLVVFFMVTILTES
jgi:hypothetical protein